MDSRVGVLAALNVVGGIAVLGSYVAGVSAIPGEALWGGVPDGMRPIYTANMFLAAAGYFFFTPYILFRLDPARTRIGGRFGYGLFTLLYALVLFPSALWLPLTGLMIDQPGSGAWISVLITLALVALGSLGLLASIAMLGPDAPRGRRWAIAGLIPFCIQTVLLDAIVWTALFPSSTH